MWHADLERDPTGKKPVPQDSTFGSGHFEQFSVLRVLRVSVAGLIMGRNSPQNHREHGEKLKPGHQLFRHVLIDSFDAIIRALSQTT